MNSKTIALSWPTYISLQWDFKNDLINSGAPRAVLSVCFHLCALISGMFWFYPASPLEKKGTTTTQQRREKEERRDILECVCTQTHLPAWSKGFSSSTSRVPPQRHGDDEEKKKGLFICRMHRCIQPRMAHACSTEKRRKIFGFFISCQRRMMTAEELIKAPFARVGNTFTPSPLFHLLRRSWENFVYAGSKLILLVNNFINVPIGVEN